MPTLNIPEDGYEGLHHIASLDESTFKAMVDGLARLPSIVYHIGPWVDCIADTTGLPKHASSSIGQAISGLSLLFSRGPLDVEGFVQEVLMAVRSREDEGTGELDDQVTFSESEVKLLEVYLHKLIGLESLVVSAVALDTLLEVERPMSEARIFADLRPVFAHKGTASISAFAVTTTMKVAWFDPSGGHETYFTLDDADVDSLFNALAEAKKQAAALKEFVKISGAHCVEIGER